MLAVLEVLRLLDVPDFSFVVLAFALSFWVEVAVLATKGGIAVDKSSSSSWPKNVGRDDEEDECHYDLKRTDRSIRISLLPRGSSIQCPHPRLASTPNPKSSSEKQVW